MSSHHFVKENQSPALIIANGEPCNDTLLHQLLEWNPYIIALDQAIETLIIKNVKVDCVLGDFDNGKYINDHEFRNFEIVHTPDQNKTDLEKAIEYLINKNITEINIIWAFGKRMDHTLHNILIIKKYIGMANLTFFDNHSKVFVLPKNYKKKYSKNSIISLFALGEVKQINTKGLKYNINNATWHIFEDFGCSNQNIEDKIVEISYTEGHLLIMECKD